MSSENHGLIDNWLRHIRNVRRLHSHAFDHIHDEEEALAVPVEVLDLHQVLVMHRGAEVPRVNADATVAQAMMEVTHKNLGMTAIVDANDQLLGVFTDGDLRRTLDDADLDIRTTPVTQVMTPGGKTIRADRLAIEAAQMMEHHKINAILVADEEGRLVGALNFHDLLRARVI